MGDIDFRQLGVGDSLPEFVAEPISRLTLALYAGASGDHNPIHVDLDYAREQGQSDVFAHGMLNMAYLGRLLTNWVPPTAIRSYQVRFSAISRVGDRIVCSGSVVGREVVEGCPLLRLELTAKDQREDVKLVGEATIALD